MEIGVRKGPSGPFFVRVFINQNVIIKEIVVWQLQNFLKTKP